MSEWFQDIGGKALAFVDSVADSAIDSLNAAQSELEKEQSKFREENAKTGQTGAIVLPWETADESLAIGVLMSEKVLNLSMAGANSLRSPSSWADPRVEFDAKLVPVALKRAAGRIARMHARLMPRMEGGHGEIITPHTISSRSGGAERNATRGTTR